MYEILGTSETETNVLRIEFSFVEANDHTAQTRIAALYTTLSNRRKIIPMRQMPSLLRKFGHSE